MGFRKIRDKVENDSRNNLFTGMIAGSGEDCRGEFDELLDLVENKFKECFERRIELLGIDG